ncbi:pyridine nucleotide disulphide reductase class-i signature [Lucifera butyrica]|uniref:Pyridine nucleotide disulphide reductase class-i signature n=1 Tax=Lucifera butyrica TaxID=1351585 RepID=A0A498R193_9FIRM|nr:FAD-dependent oxidoreductase [Lucifera butyrica]VBB06346.1 pyridine nucleotide disulphide reductase class-i signature [Lucifera butyrica]
MQHYDVLVVGGVAAGTKAAAKAKRENPGLRVSIITDDRNISYAGCGLPYYIGGIIGEQKELLVKTPDALKSEFDIDVYTRHHATAINPQERTVTVVDLETGREQLFSYEQLVLATGASPVVPPLPGIKLGNIFTVRKVEDAVLIRQTAESRSPQNAVVVGGGFIGLEVAENLKQQGINVTVVEAAPHILPNFDRDVALHLENYLQENEISIHTREKVTAFEGTTAVTHVQTSERRLPADLVILSIGVRPNVALAQTAGIALGPTGAIQVNECQETSVSHIYAVGDCAETRHRVTNEPAWIPMGSTANKTGRTAAINITNASQDSFPGVLGTTVIKLFDFAAGKTGLSEREARQKGYDYETVLVPANDKAHYYPGYRNIITKLIANRTSRKILGVQIFGEGVVDKPIDIFATAISLGATVDDVAKLDLAYAPPFSMAMSSSIVAANVMRNKLDGKLKGISPLALAERLQDPSLVVLDLRTEPEFMIGSLPGAINIPAGELTARSQEIPRNKTVIAVCKVGKRAYLMQPLLRQLGIQDITVLDGGIAGYPLPLV